MASFRKLKSGKWQVRWRDPDGKPRARSVTTVKARDVVLRDVTRCEETGEVYDPDTRADRVPSVDDGMTAFIANLHRAKEPATVERYKTAWALLGDFMAELDEVPTVGDFSRDFLAGFYDFLSTKERSLDTRHRYVENIRRAWVWLYESEWHKAVPPPRKLEMRRDIPDPVQSPTFDEMAACVRGCVSEGPRRLATILYYTGLRTMQAQTLAWGAVDLERGTLTVAPHKRLPGRIIPLSPAFVAELKRWRSEDAAPADLVTGWDVGDLTARRRLNQAWARAKVRSVVWEGDPGRAFRQGLTSGLKQLGANPETAELYVGRAVEGARRHYLDFGMVPFLPIANMIPPIVAGVVVEMKERA